MDKFLERHKFSKLTQEELENLNRPILMKEIELIAKNFPTDKIPCLDGLINEFFKTFKEKNNCSPTQTLSESIEGKNNSKFSL